MFHIVSLFHSIFNAFSKYKFLIISDSTRTRPLSYSSPAWKIADAKRLFVHPNPFIIVNLA